MASHVSVISAHHVLSRLGFTQTEISQMTARQLLDQVASTMSPGQSVYVTLHMMRNERDRAANQRKAELCEQRKRESAQADV